MLDIQCKKWPLLNELWGHCWKDIGLGSVRGYRCWKSRISKFPPALFINTEPSFWLEMLSQSKLSYPIWWWWPQSSRCYQHTPGSRVWRHIVFSYCVSSSVRWINQTVEQENKREKFSLLSSCCSFFFLHVKGVVMTRVGYHNIDFYVKKQNKKKHLPVPLLCQLTTFATS